MARQNALESADVVVSKYWDVRSPATYHLDPECPIGRWIPRDATLWGTMTAARGCEACAAHEVEVEGAEAEVVVAAPAVPTVVAAPPEPVTPISVRGSYLFAI